jgi:hypothetical protein
MQARKLHRGFGLSPEKGLHLLQPKMLATCCNTAKITASVWSEDSPSFPLLIVNDARTGYEQVAFA